MHHLCYIGSMDINTILLAIEKELVRKYKGTQDQDPRVKAANMFKVVSKYMEIKQKSVKKKHKNYCKNGICNLNMFDFCRCPNDKD